MMQLAKTTLGCEARLTSRGIGRFGSAGFLALWLAFWVVGEVLVGWLLGAGAWAFFTGQPFGKGEALATGPAILGGVFLTVWLTFWTCGGLLAWREFFRAVWSVDRLRVSGDGLEIIKRLGPFSTRRFFRRDQLVGVVRIDELTSIHAETTDSMVELTRLGSPQEQAQLVDALRAALDLPAADTQPPRLPASWERVRLPEGGEAVVRNTAHRRIAAWIAWSGTIPLLWAAATLLLAAWKNPTLGAGAAIVVALAGFAFWGTARLTWHRDEWRLERGSIVRQQRFAQGAPREIVRGHALVLSETTDSDGDFYFNLELRTVAGGKSPVICRDTHHPVESRRLARWLAAHADVPFHDQSTAEERARTAAERAAWRAEQRLHAKEWIGDWVRSLPGFRRTRD